MTKTNHKLTIPSRPPMEILLCESDEVWMPTVFGMRLAVHMAERVGSGEQILDLGSGSGIFEVVAMMRGAKKVVALDLNPAAVELTLANAHANQRHEGCDVEARVSNLFSALRPKERGKFTLLVSNPPTFPVAPRLRSKRNDWESAGIDGRLILDAILDNGRDWLVPGGKAIFIATSTQGWLKTKRRMELRGWKWVVIEAIDVPLAEHYGPFIKAWLSKGKESGEELIFKNNVGEYCQRLFFLEAINN